MMMMMIVGGGAAAGMVVRIAQRGKLFIWELVVRRQIVSNWRRVAASNSPPSPPLQECLKKQATASAPVRGRKINQR
jgi:hypothetical protein